MSKNRPVSEEERKEILQSLGLSEKKMDNLWKQYAMHRSDVIKSLYNPHPYVRQSDALTHALQIYSWKDLTKEEMLDIPMMAQSPKEYVDRKLSYTEQSTYNLIRSGYEFTEEEIQNIMHDYEVQVIADEPDRWHRHMETIVELCGRYFAIPWEEGLTEMQSNYYTLDSEYFQEVKPISMAQISTKWVSVDDPVKSCSIDATKNDLISRSAVIKELNEFYRRYPIYLYNPVHPNQLDSIIKNIPPVFEHSEQNADKCIEPDYTDENYDCDYE